MIPARVEGATRWLGAPRDWRPEENGDCSHLAIRDDFLDGGMPVMISAWEPTPAEIQKIIEGKPIYLQICGSAHPPVAVWVP